MALRCSHPPWRVKLVHAERPEDLAEHSAVKTAVVFAECSNDIPRIVN